MKLQHKIFLVVSLVVMVLVGYLSIVVNVQTSLTTETQIENAAMDMAVSISTLPQISTALFEKKQDDSIQNLIHPIIENTRYQYIIIMDMEGIQFSYPYESGLYKPYKNGGEKAVLDDGESYISADNNQLISAIRAFCPIYYEGKQVGAVLVAILTDEVQVETAKQRRTMEMAMVLGIFLGIIAAFFLSLHIKKTIFGLEPKEIAVLATEQQLIFQSIDKAMLAVNEEGFILQSNKKANVLLKIDPENERIHLGDISQVLYSIFVESLDQGKHPQNETVVLEKNKKMILNLSLMYEGGRDIIGAVISLEDITLVRALAEEITDYRNVVDSLRAQNHEFSNKLQTISGLIQLDNAEEALDYIEMVSDSNRQLQNLLSEKIRDAKLAGLLLTFHTRSSEKKIEVEILEDTFVEEIPQSLSSEDCCTIVANILNNSMEALLESAGGPKIIRIKIQSTKEIFKLFVYNSGPELDLQEDTVYARGKSSKGQHRGYGMNLVKRIVDEAQGSIYWVNEKGVNWYVIIKNESTDCGR